MKEYRNNNRIILLIIIAVIFGLTSGIVGEIVARVYLLKDIFNIPLFGELNLGNNGGGPNLIIRDAKKVVVEQNAKIKDVANNVKGSIVGIFAKKTINAQDTNVKNINSDNYYFLSKEAGQGFIITSDGWVISSFSSLPEEVKSGNAKTVDPQVAVKKNINNYVVIANDRKVYKVDNIIYDSYSGYTFWHIIANELIVKGFAQNEEIKSGELILAINWLNWIWPADIAAVANRQTDAIESSDFCLDEIILADKPSVNFNGSFLFNLNEEIVGFIDSNGKIMPVSYFKSAVNSLLKNKTIARAMLGVNYINLSQAVSGTAENLRGALITKDKNGIAVIKNSVADKIGLKPGDIILSLDNVEINEVNDLCNLISGYIAGDQTNIIFQRGDMKKDVLVKF